jgi:hypothetical protein
MSHFLNQVSTLAFDPSQGDCCGYADKNIFVFVAGRRDRVCCWQKRSALLLAEEIGFVAGRRDRVCCWQKRSGLLLAEEIGFDRYSTNNKATFLGLNNHRGMREIKPA